MTQYDPTVVPGSGPLPVGEHRFTIEETGSYEADSGNIVWKFGCVTGDGVKRTYRITLGNRWTDYNIQRLIDACGGDPAQVNLNAVEPKHFRDKQFSAWITHREHNGKTMDDFACIIPGKYRTDWEEAGRPGLPKEQANRHDAPAAPRSAPRDEMPQDEIPF